MSGTTNCSSCTDCTTPPVTGPVCPTPPNYTANSCPVVVESSCVEYDGPDQPCLGIASSGTPSTLTQVLQAIFTFLSTWFTRFTSSSLSVNASSSGGCISSVDIELVPSAQVGNILTLGNDGKPYVPPTLIGFQNSPCISWQSTTNSQGNVVWVAVLDFTCISQNTDTDCASPTSVSVTNVSTNTATVSFGTIVGNTYNILLNNEPIATGVTSPYLLTGLTPDSNYVITVQTVCVGGSTANTIVSFTTTPILTCNTPTDLQITSQ